MSVKNKMLRFLLRKNRMNSFSVRQARVFFRASNITARIADLRNDGWPVVSDVVNLSDGTPSVVYSMGQLNNYVLRQRASWLAA